MSNWKNSEYILSNYKSGRVDTVEYELKYTLQLQNTDIMKDW